MLNWIALHALGMGCASRPRAQKTHSTVAERMLRTPTVLVLFKIRSTCSEVSTPTGRNVVVVLAPARLWLLHASWAPFSDQGCPPLACTCFHASPALSWCALFALKPLAGGSSRVLLQLGNKMMRGRRRLEALMWLVPPFRRDERGFRLVLLSRCHRLF